MCDDEMRMQGNKRTRAGISCFTFVFSWTELIAIMHDRTDDYITITCNALLIGGLVFTCLHIVLISNTCIHSWKEIWLHYWFPYIPKN